MRTSKYILLGLLVTAMSMPQKILAEFGVPTASTPAAPSSVSVPSSSSSGSYTLSWSSVSGTNFYEWKEEINGSWSSSWTTPISGLSASISNRGSGSYRYQVRACNILASPSCGPAKISNTISVSLVVIPGTPSSISISDGSSSTDGAYTVSWGTSSNSPTSYQYRESINGSWGSWVSNGTSRSKAISGKANGTYSYQARGCNAAGCGSARGSSNVVVTLVDLSWQQTGGSVPDAVWNGDTPVLNGNTNVGALEGSAGVSGGAATYNIPIVIPPGRAGMQPSVSLNYSSRSGNGIAGVGWSLSAGSSIHRCGQTYAQDGFTKNVTYSLSTDKLCLDGQRLIKISGIYGYSGATYRTEIDSFARVTQSGGINSTGATFKVEHKNGRISWYGTRAYSKHIASGRSETLSWALSKVQDRAGVNTITYDYYSYGSGEYRLKNIYYTGSGSSDGDREVEFEYETRSDDSTSYLAGGLTRNTKRLSKVITKYQSQLIREYRLNYGSTSAQSHRSLLRDVTECAYKSGAPYCLPKTNFSWDDEYRERELSLRDFKELSDLTSVTVQSAKPMADFDGDGRVELLMHYTDSNGVDHTKVTFLDQNSNIKVEGSFSNGYYHGGRIVGNRYKDLDRDGKAEYLQVVNGQLAFGGWNSSTKKFETEHLLNVDVGDGWEFIEVADFNGDSYLDLLVTKDASGSSTDKGIYLYFNIASQSNTNITYANPILIHDLDETYIKHYSENGSGIIDYRTSMSSDINGDGLLDIKVGDYYAIGGTRLSPALAPYFLINNSNGTGNTSFVKKTFANLGGPTSLLNNYYRLVDLNGDGLDDLVYIASNTWRVQINQGGVFSPAINTGAAIGANCSRIDLSRCGAMFAGVIQFLDTDGDGITEIIVPKPGSNQDEPTLPYAELAAKTLNLEGLDAAVLPPHYEPKSSEGYQNYLAGSYGSDHSWFHVSALKLKKTSTGYTLQEKSLPTWLIRAGGILTGWEDDNNDGSIEQRAFISRGQIYRNRYNRSQLSAVPNVPEISIVDNNYFVMMGVKDEFKGRPHDMLTKVSTGLGVDSHWSYSAINTAGTYGNLYTPSPNNAITYADKQYIYFTSNMYVVDSFKQSDGIGGLNKKAYKYRGAMYNLGSRGFQGFRSIIVDDLSDTDSNKHIRSVSDFHQKFPLSGQLEQTRTCLIASGGEDCTSRPITKTYYKWDLWRDGVKKQTVDNAAEDFSAQVYDGQTSVNRYWVSPYNQFSYDYLTKSGHNQAMTVGGWIHHTYQNFVFNSNGCQTYARKFQHEPSNVNRTETVTSSYYHTANTSSWWLCKPNYSLTTTKAVTGRGSDYAGIESGADIQKQVKTWYKAWDTTHRKPTSIETSVLQGGGNASSLKQNVWTEYNSYGLPTVVTPNGDHHTGADMANRPVSTTYTADGYFVKTVTNSKGHVTTTTVDPIHGQATQVTDPNNQITTMTYDAFGRVRSTKLPGEPTQYTAYWWCSGVNSGSAWCPQYTGLKSKYRILTRAVGKPDNYNYYDNLNRHVYSITRNFEDDNWYYTLNKFNSKGQKIHEATLNGGVTSWQYTYYDSYDVLGRLTKKRTPQSDGGHLPTTYQYDGFVTNINAGGLEMARKYNGLGQLVWTRDAAGNYTRYAYDGTGNPITLQDANGNPIYAKYNALGQKEYVDDPNMGKKFFWYNTFGEVEKEKDANLTELTYSYDTLGRMTQRWTNGTRSGYWYWDNGNVANYKGLLRWSYDGPSSTNARVKYHYYGKTTSGKLYETQTKYRHNESGSYTDYDIIHYVDNNFGRPKGMKYQTTGLTLAYDYNALGYMSKVKNANGGYVYQEIKDLDNHGKVTRQLRANGIITELANYHAATGQMMDIRSSMTSGDSLRHELTYQYDGFSNLHKQMVVTTGGVNSEEYQYDGLHRLTNSYREFYNGAAPVSINYAYDAIGNFKYKSDYSAHTNSAYSYLPSGTRNTGAGGPNAVQSVALKNGSHRSFTYDNNGNLETGDGKTITYNEFNKPLTISKGGVTSTFSYGADLMRYKQVKTGATGGTITTYYIDKLLEKEVQGSTTKYKHYIGDVAIQTKKNSTWEIGFTHRDRLGSVVTITDQFGNVTEHRSFDPFGKPRKGDFVEPSQNTLSSITGLTQINRTTERGFTDHEQLDDHELIHMNGRAYDYNLGRFLSVDPIIQAPGNSQSMNPYSYIMNNPLAGTDPSGYCATTDNLNDCSESIGDNESQDITNEDGDTVGTIGKDSKGNIYITKDNGKDAHQNVKGAIDFGNKGGLDQIGANNNRSSTPGVGDNSSSSGDNEPNELCQTSLACDGKRSYDPTHDNYHEYGRDDDRVENDICSTSLSGCNRAEGMESLRRNAAPGADGKTPVTSDSISEIIFLGVSGGKVSHIVDMKNSRVINLTMPGHFFEEGYAIRSVVIRNGRLSIRTYGEGINNGAITKNLNQIAGGVAFNGLDRRIRQQLLNKSPEGRQKLFNERLYRSLGNL